MSTGEVDVENYRRLSEDIASAIALLSARVGRWDLVTPIDSFLDVSYDPPTMVVSLYSLSRAAEALEQTGTCALSVLGDQQQGLAERFSEPGLPLQGMLESVAHTRDGVGDALIEGSLATFSLEVESSHEAATHTLFVCRVREVHQGPARSPLVRFSKRYASL